MSINGLIKKFPSMCQFCNGDINKFVLLLRFNETLLLDKKALTAN